MTAPEVVPIGGKPPVASRGARGTLGDTALRNAGWPENTGWNNILNVRSVIVEAEPHMPVLRSFVNGRWTAPGTVSQYAMR